MGTSNWQNISYSIGQIKKINPQKILDIGVGFGKWGFLSREYLELWQGRVHSDDWKVEIDGVEIFEKNIEEHQRKIYNNIYIEDALDFIKTTEQGYDLIIIGDVLEHFNKADAFELLNFCFEKATYIMLNIPIGKYWKQDAMYGNEHEEHKSFWKLQEFNKYNILTKRKFRDSYYRLFGVIILSKSKKKIYTKNPFFMNVRNLIYQYPTLFYSLRKIKHLFM